MAGDELSVVAVVEAAVAASFLPTARRGGGGAERRGGLQGQGRLRRAVARRGTARCHADKARGAQAGQSGTRRLGSWPRGHSRRRRKARGQVAVSGVGAAAAAQAGTAAQASSARV